MGARSRVVIALVAALCLGAAGVTRASAASLGGLGSATLTGLTLPAATGAPVVVAWANFSGADGTDLDATTTNGGSKTWSVSPSGTWTISSNQAGSTANSTSLVIDGGSPSRTVAGTLFRNGATTFSAGFTVNRNASGSEFLSAEWSSNANGSVELRAYDSGRTLLASATNLYPGGVATAPASINLAVRSTSAGVITASINGTPVVSVSLTASQRTTYINSTHQHFGPFQYTSNGVRWDDFHLDNP